MPQRTEIEWTDFTSNLIRYHDPAGRDVWACVKVSPGCANCYAEGMANRYKRGGPFSLKVIEQVKPYFSDKEAAAILKSKAITGKRVFVGDMTDCWGDWVPDELLDKMFAVFALRPDVTFQVLTKRAERMQQWFGERWQSASYPPVEEVAPRPCNEDRHDRVLYQTSALLLGPVGNDDKFWTGEGQNIAFANPVWPLPNVWLGVSTENQKTADERIPELCRTPAAIRFVSYEPALSHVDFLFKEYGIDRPQWLIAGGESGPRARPCRIECLRSARDQCRKADVRFFCKQLGSNFHSSGEVWPEAPTHCLSSFRHGVMQTTTELSRCQNGRWKLRDRAGGDPSEWPEDLRVRQMPGVEVAV